MMIKKIVTVSILVCCSIAGTAQAALHDRGGGLIYDDVLNVIWLQDANYAQTTGYAADGKMNWGNAVAWASNLSYDDNVRNVTYTDWRLPSGSFSCEYANCTDSELGHLFYNELGGQAGGNAHPDKFTNFSAGMFWSGTEYSLNTNGAWTFNMSGGIQLPYNKSNEYYAWAVRDGDVAAATIPEPGTYAMFLAGLGLVGFMAQRRNTHGYMPYRFLHGKNGKAIVFK